MSKIQFWKQFTTSWCLWRWVQCCYWYVKDTILKAIHNLPKLQVRKTLVVTDMSKIQFWKQFTTRAQTIYDIISCYWYVKDTILKAIHNLVIWQSKKQLLLLICQRYNFESNSQQERTNTDKSYCCYWYVKDTILKAIHNSVRACLITLLVVTDMSKIQFWKQFTTIYLTNSRHISCYWYVKDTILKAIHN